MSKKKVSAGATMSLKDFHGGSIPSDLPLPSAPGVMARSGSDRNMSTNWGNNLLRPDHRSRPKSSGAARNFDDRASFLSHPAPIGINFDEDERKPLDGGLAPRRTINEGTVRFASSASHEMNLDYGMPQKVPDKLPTSVVSETLSYGTGFGPVGVAGTTSVAVVDSQSSFGNNSWGVPNAQNLSCNRTPDVNNSHPNPWRSKREVMGSGETGGSSSVLSGQNAVLKFTQASAVEKVASGMWQLKSELPHILYSKDKNVVNGVNASSNRANYNASLGSPAENGLVAEDETRTGGNNFSMWPNMHAEKVQTGANIGGSQLQPTSPPGMSDRPKLNLFPRSKPFETLENHDGHGYQKSVGCGKVETVNEVHGNISPKPGVTTTDGVSQPERPRLNLKPRSQPLEQSAESLERKRNTLFGSARPRELVLKERGIDDTSLHQSHSPNRNEPRLDDVAATASQSVQHIKRTENSAIVRWMGRDSERKEQWTDHDIADVQRQNWRNNKDGDKKQKQDPRPEPITWRKPIEEPDRDTFETVGASHGKVASALELAQTFSRLNSGPKTPDQYSGQQGNQIPFSRLTDNRQLQSAPTTRRHVSGY